MEVQFSIVSKLSLEEMALRRVVINLWNEMDVLDIFLFDKNLLRKHRIYEYEANWRAILESDVKTSEEWLGTIKLVKDKVLKLSLPISMQKRMLHLVKVIGSEMLRWKVSLHGPGNWREYLNKDILKQLFWSSSGALDYKKTAEILTRIETIDIVKRFKLACFCCLENYIPFLWRKLPEGYKKGFHNENNPEVTSFLDDEVLKEEVHWFCVLTKLEHKLGPSANNKAFISSSRRGNKAATEHYFQKLTDEERDSSLFRTVCLVIEDRCSNTYKDSDYPKENLSTVLCYLLSLMSSEKRMEVYKRKPCEVLRCFLDWSCQDLFLDMADLIWPFLPEYSHRSLLSNMAENIRSSGFYFPKLFQNFLLRNRRITEDFLQYEIQMWSFFPEIFIVEDIETIRVIFRNIYATDKYRIFNSYEFLKILDGGILRNTHDFIRLFLLETLEHKNRQWMKNLCVEFLKSTVEDPMQLAYRERAWNDLFESLNGN